MTFHGDAATVDDAIGHDPFAFYLCGESHADLQEITKAQEGDLIVNIVGLPGASELSGWVLMVG